MSILFDNPPPAIGCGDPGDPIDFGCSFYGGGYVSRPCVAPALTTRWWMYAEVKRTGLGETYNYICSTGAADNQFSILFDVDGRLMVYQATYNIGSEAILVRTAGQFRDPAAHYSVLVEIDTTEAVPSDRVKIVVDGIRQSTIPASVFPALNLPLWAAATGYTQYLVRNQSNFFGARQSQMNISLFVCGDGAGEVAATDFCYFNSYGHWVPKRFDPDALPLGNNGGVHKFADPLDLGKDASDNGNHFTATGLTVDNQITDTPSKNCTILNPLYVDSAKITPTNGNLTAIGNASNPAANNVAGTRIIRHKAFFAMTPVTLGNGSFYIGLQTANGLTYCYRQDGATVLAGAVSAYGAAFAVGDWVGCGYDPATGDVEFFKLVGGAWVSQGILPAAISAADVLPWVYASHQTRVDMNFGQRAWPAELPDGYTGHSTSNMPCPDILNPDDYFTVRLSSGGVDIADLPWNPMVHKTLVVSKRRDTTASWRVSDTVRGNNLAWRCDVGGLEIASSLAFTANGIDVGTDTEYQGSRVDYFWRASPKAGFDIIEVDHVTGTPTVVPHLAGGLIDYAWLVPLDGGDVRVFHRALPSGQYLRLNGGSVAGTEANWFASTAVNLTIGASLPTGRYSLPVWRTVPQLSAFVAYGGNSLVDGAFCPLDFLPRMAFIKTSQAPNPHYALDIDRAPGNPITNELQPGTNGVEDTITIDAVDFVSNGLKQRSSTSENNTTPNTIIPVAAWAQTPGKFARAR
ncbi:hypothetical protein [Thalassospira sp.]|uniref:DUF7483 domain-containing protein n=1 Tax=Thalassospira sp. TaxID=1912094 RepID=UPI0026279DDA|nr:hypothetical protein [Thalassospira sp.]MCH2276981.1 hypothetical protein [Thalassospira sp.]